MMVDWSEETAGSVDAPVVSDGVVYVVTSHPWTTSAFDAATGERRWERELGKGSSAGLVAGDGAIYGYRRTTGDDEVVKLASEDGSVQWRHSVRTTSVMTAGNGRIVTGDSSGGAVRSLDPEDGTECWQFDPDGPSSEVTGLAIDGDTIYVGTSGSTTDHPDIGAIFALDASDGSNQWHRETSSPVGGIATADGWVFAPTAGHELLALDAESSEEKWRFDGFDRPPTAPAVIDETVYVGSETLFALHRRTGEVRWRLEEHVTGTSGPSVAGDAVYVATNEGLLAVDITARIDLNRVEYPTEPSVEEGHERSIHPRGPALADRRAFVGTENGLVAFTMD